MDANALVLRTVIGYDWDAAITLAGNEPTEVVTGYGIWKTTQDKVPMVVQRRHAKRTAYVWAVSLDGGAVNLQVRGVESNGKPLGQSQAVEVTASKHSLRLVSSAVTGERCF